MKPYVLALIVLISIVFSVITFVSIAKSEKPSVTRKGVEFNMPWGSGS
jgi:hypothetical protein